MLEEVIAAAEAAGWPSVILDLRVSEDAPDAAQAAYTHARRQEEQARARVAEQDKALSEARAAALDAAVERGKADAERRQLARVARLMAGELTGDALATEAAMIEADRGRMMALPSAGYQASASGGRATVVAFQGASGRPPRPPPPSPRTARLGARLDALERKLDNLAPLRPLTRSPGKIQRF